MVDFLKVAVFSVFLSTAGSTFAAVAADGDHSQKAILITGASTGIGRHATEARAAEVFTAWSTMPASPPADR